MYIAQVLITFAYVLCAQKTNTLAFYIHLQHILPDHQLEQYGVKNVSNYSEDNNKSIANEHTPFTKITGNPLPQHFVGLGFDKLTRRKEENRKTPLLFGIKTSSFNNDKKSKNMFEERARSDAYKKTGPSENPYSVAILILNDDDTKTLCTGTLILLDWVLTSAHCLVDPVRDRVSATVYAGTSVAPSTPTRLPDGSQVIVSKRVHVHPKYDAKNVDYDLALVDVSPGFNRTEFVGTIDLSMRPWAQGGYVKCVITSFGRVQTGETDPDDFTRKTQLLEVAKPCKFDYEKVGTERNICTKPKQDYGLCTGDSGGGLVCDGNLKAVASFIRGADKLKSGNRTSQMGSSYGKCGDVNTLTAFHDTYYSLEWIAGIAPLPKQAIVEFTKTARHTKKTSKSKCRSVHTKQLLCVITLGLYVFM